MIEHIKAKLWDLLQKKEISLAMIFNREGEILWHRGRTVKGKSINDGQGFSKSCLKHSLIKDGLLEEENVVIVPELGNLPESATLLNIKSLMILPLSCGFYLYLDSGIKESFSETDREVFYALGELLGALINRILQKDTGIVGFTGTSAEAHRIRKMILKYSIEEEPILLHGETGSGKNHIAELIHHYSGRKGKFITIHTPGIPETLFESEIFGHKKGSFSGADSNKKGLVEEADGGTLFFDEIAEVPPTFQARLLRFIETRKYYKLGSTIEQVADVRFVAATNKDLHKAIEKKEFREDLYYRLQVLEMRIPPLRDHKEDIKALVTEKKKYLRNKTIGNDFWEALYSHSWPGNIRELFSVLKRAAIMADSTISGEDIINIIDQSSLSRPVTACDEKIQKIWANINTGSDFWKAVKKPFLERDINRHQVKEILRKGLNDAGGKYVRLLPLFNMKPNDYHRFMTFLSDYKLK